MKAKHARGAMTGNVKHVRKSAQLVSIKLQLVVLMETLNVLHVMNAKTDILKHRHARARRTDDARDAVKSAHLANMRSRDVLIRKT